jgi:hypothetical protein
MLRLEDTGCAMLPNEDFTTEKIAAWLFENNITLRYWLNSQIKQAILWVIEDDDRRAKSFVDRASAIRDHLREMGAIHLLH